MTILIVEDQESIQDIWKYFLRNIPAEKICVKSLSAALEEMSKIPPPDLILLDLFLIDANAETTLQTIKEFSAKNPKSVIVVLTGDTNEKLRQAAEHLGADNFATKWEVDNQVSLFRAIMKAITCPNKNREQPPFEESVKMLEMLTDLCSAHANKTSSSSL